MSVFLPDYTFAGTIAASQTVLPVVDCQGFTSGQIFVFCNADYHVDILWSADKGINSDVIDLSTVQGGGGYAYTRTFTVKARYFSLRIREDVPAGGRTWRYNVYLNDSAPTLLGAETIGLDQVLNNDNTTGGHDIDMTSGSCLKTTSGDMCISVNNGLGNLNLDGNLVVNGDVTSVDVTTLSVQDSSILLNSGYTTNIGKDAFIVNNFLPTTVTALVDGPFVAGVPGVSSPYVTLDSSMFSTGDIVQITGTNLEENDALYEVQFNFGLLLTLRGVGLDPNTYSFFRNDLTADTIVAGTVTLMTVSCIRSSSTGIWQHSNTATNTASLTFQDLGGTPSYGKIYDANIFVNYLVPFVFYELYGTPDSSYSSSDVTTTNNRLTYTGATPKFFSVNLNVAGYFSPDSFVAEIRKNGTQIVGNGEAVIECQGGTPRYNSTLNAIIELSNGDYVSGFNYRSFTTGGYGMTRYHLSMHAI